ncbi:hypothetical protein [Sphingomonas humi]|uniref:hypothetical protein n=1 Tax=Sphingomonas humi TaxID=335630 RepID=UPI0031E14A5F
MTLKSQDDVERTAMKKLNARSIMPGIRKLRADLDRWQLLNKTLFYSVLSLASLIPLSPAQAAVIFQNDFSTGLSAAEAVNGVLVVADGRVIN